MPSAPAEKGHFRAVLDDIGAKPSVALGHAPADACLGGGLRLRAVHEVYGSAGNEAAASGFALALASRVLGRHKWLLWVRQDFSALEAGDIHGNGMSDLGLDPSRVLMLKAPDATAVLRAGLEGLHCKGVGAVIIEPWGDPKIFDLVASRRLALAAQQQGPIVIVLRFAVQPKPSAAETRWIIRAHPSPGHTENWRMPLFAVTLTRNRHGTGGSWVMEWDCNNGLFQTHSQRLVAAPLDRPAETAMEGIRQAG
jgi:protein ImuA